MQPDPIVPFVTLTVIFMFFVGALLGALLTVIPFWQICKKAGFPPPLSLLMIAPIANIILLFYIAFAPWPSLADRH